MACALSATLAPGTLGTCHSSCLVPGLLLPHYPCHPGRSLPVLLALLGAYLGFASKHLFFPHLFTLASPLPLPKVLSSFP